MNTTLPPVKPAVRAKAHREILTNLTLQLWRSERLRREQALRGAARAPQPEAPYQPYPPHPPR